MVSLMLPERAEIPTVNGIADGFKVAQTQYGPTFRCDRCDAEVDP
jgi:hypothetical protein